MSPAPIIHYLLPQQLFSLSQNLSSYKGSAYSQVAPEIFPSSWSYALTLLRPDVEFPIDTRQCHNANFNTKPQLLEVSKERENEENSLFSLCHSTE